MPLVSMRQLLDHAADHEYGLPAFNVNNLEQVQAIMMAAAETDSPVIMQASAGARKYAGEAFLRHLIEAAVESHPHIPVVMHQDHGQSPDVCASAMKLGFTSVMMDGSLMADGKSIASYDYNLDVTRKVVGMAHAIGVTVEGELGCLGSLETMKGDKEDGHGAEGTMTREMLLTDPDQAADFVRNTQLDALAIAIGTSHGAYKFTRKPTGDILAIDRIKAIHARIPNTHLVMHGSSSVPQELLAIIRENGGEMKETYGVPVEEIQEGIQPRRAQDQHRHRHQARDDRGGAQVPRGEPQRFRPARLPEARARGRQGDLQGALRAVRLRGHGLEDQAAAPCFGRAALQGGRARAGRAVKMSDGARRALWPRSRPAARRFCHSVHRDMPVTNIATTAAAIVHVASQPSAFSRRVTVNGPITWGSSASSIITIMIGTAITPLITALQNSALIGIDRREVEHDAAERRQRDDRVELARFEKLAVEAALPLERLGDRVRRRPGEHRHGQHPGADDAEAEQQEGGVAGQRAAVPRPPARRSGCLRPRPRGASPRR